MSLNRDFFAQKNSISVLTQQGNRCVFPEIKPLPSLVPSQRPAPSKGGAGMVLGGGAQRCHQCECHRMSVRCENTCGVCE